MAATRISLTVVAGPYELESTTAQMTAAAGTAADASNGNVVSLNEGRVLLVLENTDAGAQTVTITSQPDAYGRTADVTAFSMAASAKVYRIFERYGWGDGNGDLNFSASDAGVLVTAIKLD